MTAPPQVAARARQHPPQKTSSSSSATVAAAAEKSTKTEKSRQTQPPQNQNVKLKVVVRGLPPNLPEAKFKEVTAEWINENTVDWYYYVTGKLYERANKPNVRSRAYVRFKNLDLLAIFHRNFNGHIFTDSKGRSSRATVEFAPYQKFVKSKIKPDPRQGTIDSSPEYKEFLDSLSQSTPSEPVVLTTEEEVTTTPLIEYLRSQKAAKAEKEKANREKMRLAKVAAAQAKANAQSAKMKAEKMQKLEAAKTTEQAGKDGKEGASTVHSRGRRRGRGASKSGNTPKGGQQQADKSAAKPTEATNPAPPPPVTVEIKSPVAKTAVSPPENTHAHPIRGRGRGRARPQGVYRPGAGRGGRGRGGSCESNPPAPIPDG